MMEYSLGIVFRDDLLTMVGRANRSVWLIPAQRIADPAEAAWAVLNYLQNSRAVESANVYIESGGAGVALIREIRNASRAEPDARHTFIEKRTSEKVGGGLHDLASKLLHDLGTNGVHEIEKLTLGDATLNELRAFEEEPGPGVRYSDPLKVAAKLGFYPAGAVAFLLATLPGATLSPPQQEHDPFAISGHDPFKDPL